MTKYAEFINSLFVINGLVCRSFPGPVPGGFEWYGSYYSPVAGFGVPAADLVLGALYMSTAFDRPVKLYSVDRVGPDAFAMVTVEYKGRLFCDGSFRMAPYRKGGAA